MKNFNNIIRNYEVLNNGYIVVEYLDGTTKKYIYSKEFEENIINQMKEERIEIIQKANKYNDNIDKSISVIYSGILILCLAALLAHFNLNDISAIVADLSVSVELVAASSFIYNTIEHIKYKTLSKKINYDPDDLSQFKYTILEFVKEIEQKELNKELEDNNEIENKKEELLNYKETLENIKSQDLLNEEINSELEQNNEIEDLKLQLTKK